jgi:putative redox protein
MQVKINWRGGQDFLAVDSKGQEISISPKKDELDKVSPPDLLLISLGSCSGLFIIPSAKALGINLEDFKIDLRGIKAEKPPKLFDKIIEEVNLIGDFDFSLASEIVSGAHAKCFILKSLNPNIEIETVIKVNGEIVK